MFSGLKIVRDLSRSLILESEHKLRHGQASRSRLVRRRGRPWEVRFIHRYDIHPEAEGSRIVYTDTADQMNYVPYWLQPWMRPLARSTIHKGDTKQLENLARLAEERAAL